jgi:hypothetical protein
LRDAISFQGHEKIHEEYLQQEVLECKIYNEFVLNYMSKIDRNKEYIDMASFWKGD